MTEVVAGAGLGWLWQQQQQCLPSVVPCSKRAPEAGAPVIQPLLCYCSSCTLVVLYMKKDSAVSCSFLTVMKYMSLLRSHWRINFLSDAEVRFQVFTLHHFLFFVFNLETVIFFASGNYKCFVKPVTIPKERMLGAKCHVWGQNESPTSVAWGCLIYLSVGSHHFWLPAPVPLLHSDIWEHGV